MRILWTLLVLASASFASAQPIVPPAGDPPPTMDVGDLLRKLRKSPPPAPSAPDDRSLIVTLAPVIGAKPTFGAIFGLAGNLAFHRGDPATTSISSSVLSATVSTQKQTAINARTTMFGQDDRWRLETDHRFQWTSQPTFGLGMNSARPASERVRFDLFRLYQSVFWRARNDLFIGGGLNFDAQTNVRPMSGEEASWSSSAYVEYSEANGLPLPSQIAAGPGVDVIWDSRDSFITPGAGSLARVGYRAFFDGFLGGDSRWDRLTVDARTYRPVTRSRRHLLALWAYADFVVDGVAPYFNLPATASDTYARSGRGYAEGHFRGEKLAFVEAEYRGPLLRNGLLGFVAFANATTVSNRAVDERLFDHVAPGGGLGLRLLLNKRSKTNLAFDIGFGERGNRGIYLAVQEAF